jgi:low affinity Fe/Cu permease
MSHIKATVSTSATTTLGSRRAGGFARAARRIASWAGHPLGFATAVAMVVVWALLGPLFNFSDTWQLVINTGTTIVTFLVVFLIQNTQNRDTHALQIKLDELLRITKGAHYALIDLEELTDEELALIKRRYLELAEEGRERLRSGRKDTGAPSINF